MGSSIIAITADRMPTQMARKTMGIKSAQQRRVDCARIYEPALDLIRQFGRSEITISVRWPETVISIVIGNPLSGIADATNICCSVE